LTNYIENDDADPVRRAILQLDSNGLPISWRIEEVDGDGKLRDAYCEWLDQGVDCIISYSLSHENVRVLILAYVIEEMLMADVGSFLEAISRGEWRERSVRGLRRRSELHVGGGAGGVWVAS
jgi:hypothetical protein